MCRNSLSFHLYLVTYTQAFRFQCKCYFLRKVCSDLTEQAKSSYSKGNSVARTISAPPPLTTWAKAPTFSPQGSCNSLLLASFSPLLCTHSLLRHSAKVLAASGPLHMLFSHRSMISCLRFSSFLLKSHPFRGTLLYLPT